MCTWGDNQPVSILSSHPNYRMDIDFPIDQQIIAYRNMQNRKKTWYRGEVFQPQLVAFYQAHMGGVDLL